MKTQKIQIGDKYVFNHIYRQSDVDVFAKITGDDNPIHINEEFASKSIFKRPIVHGFLAGATFSKVFGTLFPGNGTIYLSQNMKFFRPVFVNEEYTASFIVKEINREKGTGIIECKLSNHEGELCIDGEAKLKNNFSFK